MRTRPRLLAAAALAVASLLLASCADGPGGGAVVGADAQPQGVDDINPRPRDQVRDGGDLRWPIDALPDNFNYHQVDGTLAENAYVIGALLPGAHTALPDASVAVDTDYFTSVELTSASPQVVTYTINPKATWDDGTPLTWRDLQAQWQALNGRNAAFVVSSTTGYEDIASVERGVDDRQAVVTFARPFAEWRSLFSPIYPASTNTDPATFNTGWINKVLTSAGPFRVESIDTTAQTITLARNPKWWGNPAKLDRITFRVVERVARADALANNEIDFYQIGSDVNLYARSRTIQGVEIRQAIEPDYSHITLNGAPGKILADPALRRAIVQGIDRQVIATALIGQITPDSKPLGNYLYVQGSKDYVDHSQGVTFDPAAAGRALDALGWTSPGPGQIRARNGQQLSLRLIQTAGNPTSEKISQLVQAQLTALGVGIQLVPVASADLFDEYVRPGNFDMVSFRWIGTIYPVTSTRNIYASSGEQNFGKISSPEIDALYDQAIRELDDAKRTAMGQRIDEMIWQQMPQLPLYQYPGAYAVRSNLANFGASGFGDVTYEDMGFVQ